MLPCFPANNRSDGNTTDAKTACDFSEAELFSQLPDYWNVCFFQFGRRVSLANLRGAVDVLIGGVLGWRFPAKVARINAAEMPITASVRRH